MNDYTIIVPNNRPEYTGRILRYYEGYPVKLITDGESMYHKINNVEVDTEYCVVCADDDFISPKGIEKCVGFLDSHRDYIGARGRIVGFRKPFKWSFSPDGMYSVEQETSEKRVGFLLSNYMSVIYGVYRADVLKEAYRKLFNEGINYVYFGELFVSLYPLIRGKFKVLDTVYSFRNSDEVGEWETISSETDSEKFINAFGIKETVSKAFDIYLRKHLLKKPFISQDTPNPYKRKAEEFVFGILNRDELDKLSEIINGRSSTLVDTRGFMEIMDREINRENAG